MLFDFFNLKPPPPLRISFPAESSLSLNSLLLRVFFLNPQPNPSPPNLSPASDLPLAAPVLTSSQPSRLPSLRHWCRRRRLVLGVGSRRQRATRGSGFSACVFISGQRLASLAVKMRQAAVVWWFWVDWCGAAAMANLVVAVVFGDLLGCLSYPGWELSCL
ncbi:hypothetical protein Droror1_Dr00002854 [Drosera rotundifolia]